MVDENVSKIRKKQKEIDCSDGWKACEDPCHKEDSLEEEEVPTRPLYDGAILRGEEVEIARHSMDQGVWDEDGEADNLSRIPVHSHDHNVQAQQRIGGRSCGVDRVGDRNQEGGV